MKDFQGGNEGPAKDGKEQELVNMDVQHASAVEVVEENKSCDNKREDIVEK